MRVPLVHVENLSFREVLLAHDIDLDACVACIKTGMSAAEPVTDYESWKEQWEAGLSQTASVFRGEAAFEDLQDLVDRVNHFLQLPETEISLARVRQLFDRFYGHSLSEVRDRNARLTIGSHASASQDAVSVLLRAESVLGNENSAALVAEYEKFFDDLCSTVQDAWRADEVERGQVEVLCRSALVYAKLCQVCKVGIGGDQTSTFIFTLSLIIGGLPRSQPGPERRAFAVYAALFLAAHFRKDGQAFRSQLGFGGKTLFRLRGMLVDAIDGLRQSSSSPYTYILEHYLAKIDQAVLYDDKPQSLDSADFTREDQREIARLGSRFSSYRIPATSTRIVRFLSQFSSLRIMNLMLELLQHVKFYTLQHMYELIQVALEQADRVRPVKHVVPLGDFGGSASLMTYLAGHLPDKELDLRRSVAEHLENDDDAPLVFLDDCALSGTQSCHIFQELKGTRELKPHHTVHTEPLSSSAWAALRRRPVVLAYAISTEYARTKIKSELHELGIADVEVFYGANEDLSQKPFTQSMNYLWERVEDRIDLERELEEIGYSILGRRAKSKEWRDEWRRESALGYSDMQRLLVFEYNVPKSTLAPLWESGDFRDSAWMPLFPGM